MRDPRSFDTRLEEAFDRYVAAGAPTDVDARALVAGLASAGAAPHTRTLALPSFAGWSRGMRLAALAAALALTVAVGLLAGALLRPAPLVGGGGRIFVGYPVGPSSLVTVTGDDVAVRTIEVRGCPILSPNADATISTIRFVGIRWVGFDGGASLPIKTSYAGGERWSLDHRVLAMVNWTDRVVTFVRIVGGDVEHPVQVTVPVDVTGVPPDESGVQAFDGALSPDGLSFLLGTWPRSDGTSRLTLVDVATGATRPLASIDVDPNDGFGGIWSTDGSRVAVIGRHDGVREIASISTTTGEVRWLGHPAPAADGTFFLALFQPGKGAVPVWSEGVMQLVDEETGTWTRTTVAGPMGLPEYAFSPDGRMLATVGGSTVTLHDLATGAISSRQLGGSIWAWSPDRTAIAVLVPAADERTAQVLLVDPWSDAPATPLTTVEGELAANAPVTDPTPCIQWVPAVDASTAP